MWKMLVCRNGKETVLQKHDYHLVFSDPENMKRSRIDAPEVTVEGGGLGNYWTPRPLHWNTSSDCAVDFSSHLLNYLTLATVKGVIYWNMCLERDKSSTTLIWLINTCTLGLLYLHCWIVYGGQCVSLVATGNCSSLVLVGTFGKSGSAQWWMI